MTYIDFEIYTPEDIIIGKFKGIDRDPYFMFSMIDYLDNLKMIKSGYKLKLIDKTFSSGTREIQAVNLEEGFYSCIAPKIIDNKPIYEGYPMINGVEIRPGSKIIGGRNSGFYDAEGIVLEGKWIGGDQEKWEDWIFRVLSPSNLRQIVPNWILLDDVGSGTRNPDFSITVSNEDDSQLEQWLENSNLEILNHLYHNPKIIENLNGKNFELFLKSIYINNGFSVEKVGNWNQADGGIDLIAISKFINHDVKILIQCKTSKNNISAKPIRELNGVLDAYKAHKGIVATTSKFTKNAVSEANSQFWKIDLEDIDSIMLKLSSLINPRFSEMINIYGNKNSH
jgi:hypothetical protein